MLGISVKKLYPIQSLKLGLIRYICETHDKRETISSADGPVFDTYWIYLIETVDKEEREIREDAERDWGATIVGPEEERKLLIDSVSDGKVYARELRDSESAPRAQPFELKVESLSKYRFEIRYFFKETDFEYSSPITAGLERLFRWNIIRLWQFRSRRKHADRNIALLEERVTVLEKIIELEDERNLKGTGADFLAKEIYGPMYSDTSASVRIAVIRRMTRIINSLKHTKELEQYRDTYRTTGKAIATIFDHREQIKRHREARSRDSKMLWATFLIAIATAVQAYSIFSS